MICRHYGLNQTFNTDEFHKKITPQGLSLLTLVEIAAEAGFECTAHKCNIDELTQNEQLPGIALLQRRHYVVVIKMDADTISVADPAMGIVEFSHFEFAKRWCDPSSAEGVFVKITKGK
jgi:ATP-binding cassette subfamily B protein